MKENILSEVIAVEKEIQKRLEIERTKLKERLEIIKSDSEAEILSHKAKLKGSLGRVLKEARLNAEEESSAILKNATSYAEKLKNINDRRLKEIILRHIRMILPGE